MLTWVIGVVALSGISALAVRGKMRRDAIYQRGVWVGSAMSPYLAPGGTDAHFAIVRGTADFQENRPFRRRGVVFQMVSWDGYDARSTVLRRFLNVTCRVLPCE